ncbi:uncharacterized protein B0I36DRAFT_331683 [Microdochium trichocladiopsis]|uniref:Uncharacterized protein n=1 Tax=Microdochium trichocladiopsis TaxID=1682393 RepID=A0A9P8XXF1_9PEZI|nr:uncharacterized protein B0I36DRAFT_331683 [Microdochium trichocladiopsis]KAH7024603.1 hypothetical protein B0I36DRAFT_331683 [Microdochium trichocladiopsis]
MAMALLENGAKMARRFLRRAATDARGDVIGLLMQHTNSAESCNLVRAMVARMEPPLSTTELNDYLYEACAQTHPGMAQIFLEAGAQRSAAAPASSIRGLGWPAGSTLQTVAQRSWDAVPLGPRQYRRKWWRRHRRLMGLLGFQHGTRHHAHSSRVQRPML